MFDYLIRNAAVADGSGADVYTADVAIAGGTIAAVGRLDGAAARRTIDAAGRTLTPGFIDLHRHADAALFSPDFGQAELAQGLTTLINGNCGLSLAPVEGPHRQAVLDYLGPIVGEMPAGHQFPTWPITAPRPARVPGRSTPACWWAWAHCGAARQAFTPAH